MRPIPIGIDLFRKLRDGGYYYVDKTRMISTLLDNRAGVTLITRPRRFGKTLNMDMVKEFFDITADSAGLFGGLEIMAGPYAKELNSRPVLSFSFKDCKDQMPLLMRQIKTALEKEFDRFEPIVCGGLSEKKRREFEEIQRALSAKGDPNWEPLWNCIAVLSEVVAAHYQKPVIVLIDEYDTPMSAAHSHGCYEQIRPLFSSLYGTALKGNSSLDMALMTGIQRVAKENIFSGLNNLLVCTAESSRYADSFGFTEPETRLLLEEYGLQLDDSVKSMYDGYRFGNAELYNPWSILNYASEGQLIPYWVNTSSNHLLRERLEQSSPDFKAQFDSLILHGELAADLDLQTGTYENGGDAALWGLFVNAGYLTFADGSGELDAPRRLRIPNGEVQNEFKDLVAQHIGVARGGLETLFDALVNRRDPESFAAKYQEIVKTITSYHDAKENAYHMLMLGMCVWLRGRYEITSNRESGLGRSDILLKAARPSDWNIIIEFKHGTDLSGLAQAALVQIEEKEYFNGLTGQVLLLGIAHSGKECEVQYRELNAPKEELAEAPGMKLE